MASILWLKLKLKLAKLFVRPKIDDVISKYLDGFNELDLDVDLKDTRIVCVDIETTGLDVRKCEIVSIGAIGIKNLDVDLNDSLLVLVKSGNVTEESIKIHKITPDLLVDAYELTDALKEFLKFVGKDVICTFSLFDYLVLNRDLRKCFDIPLLNPIIDVQRLGKKLLSIIHPYYHYLMDVSAMSLEELARRLEIPIVARHTSLGDAFTTSLILLSIVKKNKIKTLKELYRLS